MPVGSFAAGPYTATFNTDDAPGSPAGKGLGARDIGLISDVRRWQRTLKAREVSGSAFGATHVDAVYRGGQCLCMMTVKEWSQAVKDLLWPFGETFGQMGQVGRMMSDLAGELTLTAVPNTPAATTGPATLIFRKAILSPSHNSEVVLAAEDRDVPVMMQCFPYVNGQGNVVWFEEQ